MKKLKQVRDILITVYAEIMHESANQVSSEQIKRHIKKIGHKFISEIEEKELSTDIMYFNQIEIIANVCAKHALLLKEKKDGKI